MSLHITAFLRDAVVHYGYWAVAAALLIENVGVPVPGETILLLASFLAYSQQELQLGWIIVVATAVTAVGGSLGYALGHYGGRPLLDRYRRRFHVSSAAVDRGERLFERFGAPTIFVARFIFGLRLIVGPLAGVMRMSWRKFLVWNFFGAAAWVTVISSAGYLFGRHWHRVERYVKRFNFAVIALVLVVALVWWLRNRARNRNGHPGS